MSKALSLDLRTRVLAAIGGGLSCRQAAQRFGVSASSAIRWRALERTQGDARPKALGGDRRSGRVEERAGLIHAPLEGRRQCRIDPDHRKAAPPSHRRTATEAIVFRRAGEVVARRSLDFYDAVARQLAGQGGAR